MSDDPTQLRVPRFNTWPFAPTAARLAPGVVVDPIAPETCVLLSCTSRAAPDCLGDYISATHHQASRGRDYVCQRCCRHLRRPLLPELNRLPPRHREESPR